MNISKRIFTDEIGFTRFDDYFAHLGAIESKLPLQLAEFATDVQRYSLNSDVTLHDSWLQAFQISKSYVDRDLVSTTVRIELLQAKHTHSIHLEYGGVTSITFSADPAAWPLSPVDLLTHEFDVVGDGEFQHYMQFDREVWLALRFQTFAFRDVPCPVTNDHQGSSSPV